MKVIQIVPTLFADDDIGNNVIAIDKLLREEGYDTQVYAETVQGEIAKRITSSFELLLDGVLCEDDIVLFHLGYGHHFSYRLPYLLGKKVLIYHSITPSSFFEDYDRLATITCLRGIKELQFLSNQIDYAIVDLEYNKKLLASMGYFCPIDIVPVITPFPDYLQRPNTDVIELFKHEKGANILFTGEIVPNKCQHDVIAAFYMYQKYFDNEARLFLVGEYKADKYYASLLAYIEDLGVNNVVITGLVTFDELLAYYTVADIFLCQSEFEGFCISLLEAITFDVPIVGFSSAGVSNILADSGILLSEKNPLITAGVVNEVIRNNQLRNEILKNQRKRLDYYECINAKQLFLASLRNIISLEQ